MALHYIGNVETLDRNQVGAPTVICPRAPVKILSWMILTVPGISLSAFSSTHLS
jgi:hypothetical protein